MTNGICKKPGKKYPQHLTPGRSPPHLTRGDRLHPVIVAANIGTYVLP
ncbi:hypothetical protein [Planktothricoides sp. SR001]|nr:hypothetical protein [Planktothricoides sp. SR001]